MGEANEGGEDGGEEGKAKVLGDELREVREEGVIEREFDAGGVEAAVVGEGMKAVHEKCGEGERAEDPAPSLSRPGLFFCGGFWRRCNF